MKFFYEIGTQSRVVEFAEIYGETSEVLIPLKLLCEDLGISYRDQVHRPYELAKINGKGQATAHCTLTTICKMLEDLTQPNSFAKLKPISQSIVKAYNSNFANFINAQINPVVKEQVQDIWDTVGTVGVGVMRRDLVLDGCSPSEINSIMVTGAREIVQVSEPPIYLEGYSKPPEPGFVFTPTITIKRQQLGQIVPGFDSKPDFGGYVEGTLRRSRSRSLRQFEKQNPGHPATQRKLDYSFLHDVAPDGKSLVYTGPLPERKPWDNEPTYVNH